MSSVVRFRAAAICARVETGARVLGAFAVSCQRSPSAVTGIQPACISRVNALPVLNRSRTTWAVPNVGWPAKGISKPGVKIRTLAAAVSEGRMKVVSDRLNCKASACRVASSRPRASSNTARGFPPSGVSAKTLSRRKRYVFIRRPAESLKALFRSAWREILRAFCLVNGRIRRLPWR